ncbi:hypothetical protein BDA99DRAFT_508871, partial [Phascolomyces articulosus]
MTKPSLPIVFESFRSPSHHLLLIKRTTRPESFLLTNTLSFFLFHFIIEMGFFCCVISICMVRFHFRIFFLNSFAISIINTTYINGSRV